MSGLTHNVSAQANELLDHIYEYGTNSEGVTHRINQLCDAAVEQLRAEIERLNSCIRYEQHRAERIGTHGPDTWVIVGPKGLAYVGLHVDEHDAWEIYLGWPAQDEITERKAQGWYAAKATITWTKP